MTTYFTNYSEYPTGQKPSDWSIPWQTDSYTVTIEDDTGSPGGKRLLSDPQSGGKYSVKWDAPGVLGDVEILTQFFFTTWGLASNDHHVNILARGSGALFSENGYLFTMRDNLSGVNIWRYVNGSATLLGSYEISLSKNTRYFAKFKLEDTALKAKIWLIANAEPAWQIEVTDAHHAEGWVGVGGTRSETNIRVDTFQVEGVGAGGGGSTPTYIIVNIIT